MRLNLPYIISLQSTKYYHKQCLFSHVPHNEQTGAYHPWDVLWPRFNMRLLINTAAGRPFTYRTAFEEQQWSVSKTKQ